MPAPELSDRDRDEAQRIAWTYGGSEGLAHAIAVSLALARAEGARDALRWATAKVAGR